MRHQGSRPGGRGRDMTLRARITTAVAAMTTVAVVSLLGPAAGTALAAKNDSERITGTVQCSGGFVQGIFLEALKAKDRFLEYQLEIGTGSVGDVKYSFVLPDGGAYRLHVGCPNSTGGGWDVTAYTDWVTGSHNFDCGSLQIPISILRQNKTLKGVYWALKYWDPPYGQCVFERDANVLPDWYEDWIEWAQDQA